MIFFLVDEVTPRWIYTLDFVFKVRGLSYHITEDKSIFEASNQSKINLSEHPIPHVLSWKVSNLLGQNGLEMRNVQRGEWEGVDCLSFQGQADVLASIFYVLSRYEEYTNTHRDKHDRFSAKFSLQTKFDWAHQPIADIWAVAFLKLIGQRLNKDLAIKVPPVHLVPTFDIDNTFAYLNKSGSRKWLAISKDLLHLRWKRLRERRDVLTLRVKDPYDTFRKIHSIGSLGYDVKVFWLLGDFGPYDKNLSHKHSIHRAYIKAMAKYATVGIHPSYQSNFLKYKVYLEIKRLEEILEDEKEVKISRQHFLKIKLPETYHTLINYGVKEDYSMGFADDVGFRMGTANPVFWYDLVYDRISSLKLKPLIYMDGTLNEYLKLTPSIAKSMIKKLYREVQTYGGEFVFLWHNETINNHGDWKNWSDVLDFTLGLPYEKK